MAQNEQVKAAKAFAAAWAGRGYEKGDAQVFWTELLRDVCGVAAVSRFAKFEYHTSGGGFIDCFIPDAGALVEQKAIGVDLDKPELRQGRMVTPFEQALAYAQSFRKDQQPRFVVTCNFATFRVYDRNLCPDVELPAHCVEFTLEELGESPHLLGFITDPANSRAEKERQASMEAGALIGKLHEALRARYIDPDSPESAHSLNVLCVRLVFCLFCEDAGLFPKDAMLNYLRSVEPADMRDALKKLFRTLDTPLSERDPYDEKAKAFPYVNGGLFADDVEIPNFTADIKHLLLFEVSQQTDWSRISPTIFGGIFESTLNPETRRAGGMHYTSPENIHKVIDPLFLDELRGEFDAIRSDASLALRKRKNALTRFHAKIAGLQFLDPACGSGNFLTETYLSLRRLEDDVLNALNDGQAEIAWGGEESRSDAGAAGFLRPRVSLSQLHGIEINDFACRVAQVALWIAQLQANQATDMLLDLDMQDFPLTDAANIVQANALRTDWNDVLPAEQCDYVMGNPPFVGSSNCTKAQKDEIVGLYGKRVRRSSSLDYVSGWYYKACEYMGGSESHGGQAGTPSGARVVGSSQGLDHSFGLTPPSGNLPVPGRAPHAAFVSTNSITFGEQVHPIWNTLRERFGVRIDFAWPTFVWNSEAEDKAHVHVVVVGFSCGDAASDDERPRFLFDPATGEAREVPYINPYLADAPWATVEACAFQVSGAPRATFGCKPADGGNYVFTPEEKDAFIAAEPESGEFFRPFLGSRELLNGKERWCLYLANANPVDISRMPLVMERVRAVRDMRLASSSATTRKAAETPMRFFFEAVPKDDFIAIPEVSSERRRYVPAAVLPAGTVPSNKLLVVCGGLYEFGIVMSRVHNAWMRRVTGRLESRYQYSPAIVYNTFVWPEPTDVQRSEIERCAQAVLDAREAYAPATLAELYDPDKALVFPELTSAHAALDAAVEAAYGVDFAGDEEKIVAHLFRLYTQATGCEKD